MEQKELPGKAILTFQDNNILVFKILPKIDFTADDAVELVKIASELSGEKTHCNLVDISEAGLIDSGARDVFAKQKKKSIPAIAIVFKTTFQKCFVNFYLKFTWPYIPTKAFDDTDEATEWLLTQM